MFLDQNVLQSAKSPYLKQHAGNPVHWQEWSAELIEKAIETDRLIILSIGYSACHWCHVMEREVFEREDAAEVMNQNFISIKVDREERPDIDEIYMRALQLMKGQGGWPLNMVCLPDGKPIWGGTYVPKDQWIKVLGQLAEMYREDRQQVINYGEQLTQGIQQSMLLSLERRPFEFAQEDLDSQFKIWQRSFDHEEGGTKRAPKFPMPVNWSYLLDYGISRQNEAALNQVEFSLDKMAMGGIYDQIGGGFARYSVDALWKVPHFEKMLYDNAQLLALYSKAYRHFKKELYLEVIEQSWEFLLRKMRDESGAWYSALDADSEGEEGKYYIWTADELQKLIPATDWALFAAYYSINENGYWENGQYILLRRESAEALAKRFVIEIADLKVKVKTWQNILLKEREQRIKPGLDNKALCSWNALMITAACETYRATGQKLYLKIAEETAQWILEHQSRENHLLFHAWQEGEAHIEGLLEDYAFCIEAFIHLWQISAKEEYLHQAKAWTEKVSEDFEDRSSGLFYTRPKSGEKLISPGMETQDNVMPSANSTMAHNLFKLGLVFAKSLWTEQAQQNLGHVKSQFLEYGESYANWSRLALFQDPDFYEIALIGSDTSAWQKDLEKDYHPLHFLFRSEGPSEIPAFKDRWTQESNRIFPCQKGACQLPYTELNSFKEDFH